MARIQDRTQSVQTACRRGASHDNRDCRSSRYVHVCLGFWPQAVGADRATLRLSAKELPSFPKMHRLSDRLREQVRSCPWDRRPF